MSNTFPASREEGAAASGQFDGVIFGSVIIWAERFERQELTEEVI
jgi:hypothetical protein